MPKIELTSPTEKFDKFLQSPENRRILFSGKYGIGKTFFLKDFFEQHKEEYNCFTVYPVNYVVSQNEDIFELIKADIIVSMFLTGFLEYKKFAENTLLQNVGELMEKPWAIVKFLTEKLAKLNPMVEAANQMIQIIEKVKDSIKKTKARKPTTAAEDAGNFVSGIELQTGSIYEYNYITQLIINLLKDGKAEKKNVLVIDDLDRIDPEHIFRILNILSAHNHHYDQENKFGFDIIIIACDIENIKKIFEHKFGAGVDFSGYIDKFFSTEIFSYSNDDAIRFYLENCFTDLASDGEFQFWVFMFNQLLANKKLTIRKLIKHTIPFELNSFELQQTLLNQNQQIRDFQWTWFHTAKIHVASEDLRILRFFKAMAMVYGNFDSFLTIITSMKDHGSNDFAACEDFLGFLGIQNHIASAKDLSLYYSVQSYSQSYDEMHPPIVRIGSQEISIQLKWARGNAYSGAASYFNGASGILKTQRGSQPPNESITKSNIYTTVYDIARWCEVKGWLQKAGIN